MERASPEQAAGAVAAVDLVTRHTRLVRRTVLVSGLTLVSRLLGFAREMLSAALFGDRSPIFDAFITAWRVPNLFRRFLGEGALSTSFQTELTRTESEAGEEAGRALFLGTLRLLAVILVALCVAVSALVLVLPDAMPVTGWRWLGADPGPVRELTVRLMPFVILVCIAALVSGALHVRGRFGAPAWAPAAMNVVWIGALLMIVWRFGWSAAGRPDEGRHLAMARWLAWGVLIAGAAQLAVQVPALRAAGFLGGRRASRAERPGGGEALSILKKSLPLAFGAAVYQINVMLDGLMAEGLLPDGGPTLHYYANRVQQFPLALIAVAATSAVFPLLQALGARRDREALRAVHDRTHRAIAFVALPASVGLAVLARPVVSVCFEHGAFGPEGVERTAAALRVLTLAILPAGATGLVARTYYAMGDFSTPVKVSCVMLAANAALNVVFILGLGMDVDGLALATALTAWANLAALLPGLRSRLRLPVSAERARPWLAMLAASAACGATAALAERALAARLGGAPGLFGAIVLGGAAYLAVSHALGVPELRRFTGRRRA